MARFKAISIYAFQAYNYHILRLVYNNEVSLQAIIKLINN